MATKKKSLINSRAAAQKAILATHNTPLAATPSVSSVDPQLKAGAELGARAKATLNVRGKLPVHAFKAKKFAPKMTIAPKNLRGKSGLL